MTTLQADVSVQTVQIIDPNHDELDLNLKQYIHYCCDKCEYKSRESVVFKLHLDENHNLALNEATSNDAIAEDVEDVHEGDKVHEGKKEFKSEDLNFKCGTCGKCFPDYKSLVLHISTVHEGKKQHQCHICEKYFSRPESLQIHIKVKHEGKKHYQCKFCDKEFKYFYQRRAHVLADHEELQEQKGPEITKNMKCEIGLAQEETNKTHPVLEEVFQCIKCQVIFDESWKLTMHVSTVHEGRKDNQCPICEKIIKYKPWMKRHIQYVHEGKKPFQCPICQKGISCKQRLQYHLKSKHKIEPVHEEKFFQCQSCQKVFEESWKLTMHISTVHVGRKDNQCPFCQKIFEHKPWMKRHIRYVHEGKKPFQCQQGISTKKDFQNHLKVKHKIEAVHEERKDVHLDVCEEKKQGKCEMGLAVQEETKQTHDPVLEEVFQCQKCQVVFDKSSKLTMHVSTCTVEGSKNNICPICEISFKESSKLTMHISTVHEGRKNNQCPICEKVFKYKPGIKAHIRSVHEGKKPFQCPICQQGLSSKANVENHLKVKHKIEPVHEERNDLREVCDDMVYSSDSLLKYNFKNVQKTVNNEKEETITQEEKNELKRQICETDFGQTQQENVHAEKKQQKCEIGLAQEEANQSNPLLEEGFQCQKCQVVFDKSSKLTIHISTCLVEGSKNNICPICEISFKESWKLTMHISTVHEGRQHNQCPICEKIFADNGKWMRFHIRSVHEGEKPFQCPICQQGISSKPNLQYHLKSRHQIVK